MNIPIGWPEVPLGGLLKFSTIDFPGVLSCVLFVRGCDLDCFYCHNRTLLSPGENLPWEEVLAFLAKRAGMLDGVVVSGGEPTLHPALPALLEELKSLGYKVKLDTNGSHPEAVAELLRRRLADYVAVDWKAPREDFQRLCGAPPDHRDKTRETIELLLGKKADFEVRTTLYPGLDGHALLALAGELPPVPRYRLNHYKKPLVFRPEDEEWLSGRALSPGELKLLRMGLLAVQPNMILE